MKNHFPVWRTIAFATISFLLLSVSGCDVRSAQNGTAANSVTQKASESSDKPEYFMLRPEVEKQYGYTHAIKIGRDLTISGAVSMDDKGTPTAKGDMAQQMKNAYADLDKILKHFGYTFDDVVKENVFTTDMAEFIKHAGYRNEIYKKQYPAGTWLGVKELALPEFMIEIELEAHRPE